MSSYPHTNEALSRCCDINHEQFIDAVRPLIDRCHELEDELYREDSPEDVRLRMAAREMYAALKAMDALTGYVWDMTSGDAVIMEANVPRLNEALNLIGNAVRKAEGLSPLVED